MGAIYKDECLPHPIDLSNRDPPLEVKNIEKEELNLEQYDGQPYPVSKSLKEGMDKLKKDYELEIEIPR